METFLIKAAQLILALAILVVIHEFGHFLFARMFGAKVEKFYIFFNPLRSLFKWKPGKYVGTMSKVRFLSEEGKRDYETEVEYEKASAEYTAASSRYNSLTKRQRDSVFDKLFGKRDSPSDDEVAEALTAVNTAEERLHKASSAMLLLDKAEYEEGKKMSAWKRFWRGTTYGIGWVPLGGYCRISGMIDESMDTEQMKRPAQPWEFRSKPAWQRLLIMIAGVLFNFLLAIVIYAGIVFCTGEKYVPFNEARMGMVYSDVAKRAGFRDGDIPLTADGKPLDFPGDARVRIMEAGEVTVLRGSDTVAIKLPSDFMLQLNEEATSGDSPIVLMNYRYPTRVTQVSPGGGAAKAGIRELDEIIKINNTSVPSLFDFLAELKRYPGDTIQVTVVRPVGTEGKARTFGEPGDTLALTVPLSDGAKMGIGLETDPSAFFKAEEKHYTLWQAVPRGIRLGTDKLTSYAASMKMVFTKEGAKSVGGFGALGSIFPSSWDWIAFWNIAAFISVALAFMNILPIPALDGGHVLFLLYEVVTGRAPSQKFMEYAQMTGMLLLLALLIYANFMDVVRFFF